MYEFLFSDAVVRDSNIFLTKFKAKFVEISAFSGDNPCSAWLPFWFNLEVIFLDYVAVTLVKLEIEQNQIIPSGPS